MPALSLSTRLGAVINRPVGRSIIDPDQDRLKPTADRERSISHVVA
jgi:hypothetical protein